MRALIASGTGRYADPWHPFPETSSEVARILRRDAGFDVHVDDDVDHAMTALEGVDLLIVNAGDPWREDKSDAAAPAESIAGFADALERGIGVLALHCAVSSLRDYPQWYPAIGGMWVPSLSYHPPVGLAQIAGVPNAEGIDSPVFDVVDEKYCRIQRLGPSDVVAHHAGATDREPSAWVRRVGASRVAVDLLGHDQRSYRSVGRCSLLVRLAVWSVGGHLDARDTRS